LRDSGILKVDPNNRRQRTYGPQSMLEYALENGLDPDEELARLRQTVNSTYEPRLESLRANWRKTQDAKQRRNLHLDAKRLTQLRDVVNLDTDANEILSGLHILRTEALPGDDTTASDRDLHEYSKQKYGRKDGPSSLKFWKQGAAEPLTLNASMILATELKRDANAQARLNAKGAPRYEYLLNMLHDGIARVMNRGYALNLKGQQTATGKGFDDKLGLRRDMPVWREKEGDKWKPVTYGELLDRVQELKKLPKDDASQAIDVPPQSELAAIAQNEGFQYSEDMQDWLREHAVQGPGESAAALEAAQAQADGYNEPLAKLQRRFDLLDGKIDDRLMTRDEYRWVLDTNKTDKARGIALKALSEKRRALLHGRGSWQALASELRGEIREADLGEGATSTQEIAEAQDVQERQMPQPRLVEETTGLNLDAEKRTASKAGEKVGSAPKVEAKPSLEGLAEAAGLEVKNKQPPKPKREGMTGSSEGLGPPTKEQPKTAPPLKGKPAVEFTEEGNKRVEPKEPKPEKLTGTWKKAVTSGMAAEVEKARPQLEAERAANVERRADEAAKRMMKPRKHTANFDDGTPRAAPTDIAKDVDNPNLPKPTDIAAGILRPTQPPKRREVDSADWKKLTEQAQRGLDNLKEASEDLRNRQLRWAEMWLLRAHVDMSTNPSPEIRETIAKLREFVAALTPEKKQVPAGAAGSVVVTQHKETGYRARTVHNVKAAGTTVAIAADFDTAGERLTRNTANLYGTYVAIPFTVTSEEAGKRLAAAMAKASNSVLNVAGNGIYTLAKHGWDQARVNQFVYRTIKAAHDIRPISGIVTGGQTGVDIAGAVAARALGIPVVVTMPQGFLQRNEKGDDLRLTKAAVEKQIEDGAAKLAGKPTQVGAKSGFNVHPVVSEFMDSLGQQVRDVMETGFPFEKLEGVVQEYMRQFREGMANDLYLSTLSDEERDAQIVMANDRAALFLSAAQNLDAQKKLESLFGEGEKSPELAQLEREKGAAITRITDLREIYKKNKGLTEAEQKEYDALGDKLDKLYTRLEEIGGTEEEPEWTLGTLAKELAPLMSADDGLRVLLELAATATPDTPVKVTDLNHLGLAGMYDPEEDEVLVARGGHLPSGGIAVLVHEAVHAATVHALATNSKLLEAASALLAHATKQDPTIKSLYGGLNKLEFIAEGLTNTGLRQRLEAIPASQEVKGLLGNVANLWAALKEIIRRALNLKSDTALEQLVALSTEMFQATHQSSRESRKGLDLTPMLLASTSAIRQEFAERYASAKLAPVRKAVENAIKNSPEEEVRHVIKADLLIADSLEEFTDEELLDFAQQLEAAGGIEAYASYRQGTLFQHGPRNMAVMLSGRKFSRMDPHKGPGMTRRTLTKENKAALEKEVFRLLGDKNIDVAFRGAMKINPDGGAHGSFRQDSQGKRFIEIASNIGLAPAESAAHHEALHGLFALLDSPTGPPELRQAAVAVRNAVRSAKVRTKLRELLKDHPAAWEAALHDPEEAAAYTFQFWRAGLITNADLNPSARNFFERLARWIRKFAGLVSTNEKALAIFNAFQEGKFANADPSIAGAVIRDMRLKTLGEVFRLYGGPAYTTGEKMLVSATDRLRATGIPTLERLANMYHKETNNEHGRLGFLQRRQRQKNLWQHEANIFLKSATQEQLARALKTLQNQEDSDDPLVVEARKLLERMHEYQTTAGVTQTELDLEKTKAKGKDIWADVPLRKVKNYWPRLWDFDIIQKNEEEFKKLLMEEGKMDADQADKIFLDLMADDKTPLRTGVDYTPYMLSASTRVLTFIKKHNAHKFAKFQYQDLVFVMTMYIYQATHRAEYAKTFGNHGETINAMMQQAAKEGATKEQLEVATKAVQALNGTLGWDMDRERRQMMQNLMAYENIVLLPMVLLQNFSDIMGIAMRSDSFTEAWKAFKMGIKDLVREIRKQPRSAQDNLADMIGLMDDEIELANYGMSYDGVYIGGFAKKVNDRFFKYTGMQSWNRSMRTAAMITAINFIQKHWTNIKTGNDKDGTSARKLEELGLKVEDIRINPLVGGDRPAILKSHIAASFRKPENDKDVEKATEKIQEAIFRFVDGAVIRPNAAHRPIWGSDPHWMLIFHLKQFTYSFTQVFHKYIAKELDHGNAIPGYVMLTLLPFSLATGLIKAALLGRPMDLSPMALAWQALSTTGATGTAGFAIDAFEDLSRNQAPGVSFIGPTAGHALMALQTLAGSPQDSWSSLVLRSVPASPIVKAVVE
jgi:hypothetical protein